MKNKAVVSIILVLYAVFTYYTFATVNSIQASNHVKYLNNEYKVENIDNKRKVEVKLGSKYMMGEEDKANAAYFDNFMVESKSVIKLKVFKGYSFISMIVMCLLCFVELYPKNKYITSKVGIIFIMLFIISSMVTFNINLYEKEVNLSNYFHERIS